MVDSASVGIVRREAESQLMKVMPSKRLENIDALRAIAALCVLFEHLLGDMLRVSQNASGAFSPIALAIMDSFSFGRFGVVLFFLISGFVVPFSIRGERPLVQFTISRIFRLYPAIWFAIGLITVLSWQEGLPAQPGAVAANLTMMPALFGERWLNEAYWTLFVEIVFYALTAALFAAGLLRSVRALFLVGFLLLASTVLPVLLRERGVAVPVLYLGLHVSFLIAGLLLRLQREHAPGAATSAASLLLLQVIAVYAVSDFSLGRGDRFLIGGVLPMVAAYVAAILVFVAAIRSDRPRVDALVRIGAISYSIYLFHGIVDPLVYHLMPLSGGWIDLLTMAVCAAATIVFSVLVYLMIEKPMIRHGHRIARQITTRRSVSAQPVGTTPG